MRKLILATASAIALGIAGATPLYAQNLNTGPAATPAPQDQGTAAGTMRPGTSQTGDQMQQTPPATGANINNPDMASSSQAGGDSGRMSRTDIQNIQQKLSQDGFYHGKIDGRVGPETQQGLRTYQRRNHLPVTGTLDQQTLASLNGTGAGMGSSTMPNTENNTNGMPSSNSGTGNPAPSPAPSYNQH